MVNILRDYIESDYAPMPYMDSIWLPKCFNDRKYLIRYVRKATRLGIWLTNDVTSPVWQSVKAAKKAGFNKEQLHERAEWAKQSNHLAKYAAMFQQKLIEVEYEGVMPSPNKNFPLIVEERDELNPPNN
tara:strand:- start:794 stop:1180 length:387 start_codon:yes stop_codon:yes gene_type:complete